MRPTRSAAPAHSMSAPWAWSAWPVADIDGCQSEVAVLRQKIGGGGAGTVCLVLARKGCRLRRLAKPPGKEARAAVAPPPLTLPRRGPGKAAAEMTGRAS